MRACIVNEAHNLLVYVTIRPGVVAEAGTGSNSANQKSMHDARGSSILMPKRAPSAKKTYT